VRGEKREDRGQRAEGRGQGAGLSEIMSFEADCRHSCKGFGIRAMRSDSALDVGGRCRKSLRLNQIWPNDHRQIRKLSICISLT